MASEPEEDWIWTGAEVPTADEKALAAELERAYEAIRDGDAEALAGVLERRPDLAKDYHWGPPLLDLAAELGQARAVSVLLDAGLSPGWTDESGGTPLMTAAWEGHPEVVRILLAAGADPDVLVEDHYDGGDPSVIGLCALHFALYKRHQEVVDLLEPVTRPEVRALAYESVERRREADAEIEAEEGPRMSEATVRLFIAIQDRRPDRLLEAIAEGGDVDAVLEPGATNRLYGGTPLSFAASSGRMDLIEPLLEAGADPGLVSHGGLAPGRYAELNGHPAVAEFLLDASRSGRSSGDRG
jgi:hypothetical protein